MPVRPSNVDPEQAARWAQVRATVGANIRRRRIGAELSQEALALEASIGRNHLIGLEHGRRGLLFERLPDLAAVLNCQVGELFFEDSGRTPS